MAAGLIVPIILILFVALLGLGRAQLAKGSNREVANGAVLLTLGAVFGVLALGALASLEVW